MYTEKDLVAFGNYVLSDARKTNTNEVLHGNVTHADLENYKQDRALEKNQSRENTPSGETVIVDWEILEKHEAIDPPHVWSASATGTDENGNKWSCACTVMNQGGDDWMIESYSDVERI